MRIYCFGNEFLEDDSLAKEIADEIHLPGVEFIKCNSPEEIFNQDNIIILDVVDSINKATLIKDLSKLKNHNTVTLHDFDLSFFLKLMKEMKKIKKINIIGIPMNGNKEKIKEDIINLLNKI